MTQSLAGDGHHHPRRPAARVAQRQVRRGGAAGYRGRPLLLRAAPLALGRPAGADAGGGGRGGGGGGGGGGGEGPAPGVAAGGGGLMRRMGGRCGSCEERRPRVCVCTNEVGFDGLIILIGSRTSPNPN